MVISSEYNKAERFLKKGIQVTFRSGETATNVFLAGSVKLGTSSSVHGGLGGNSMANWDVTPGSQGKYLAESWLFSMWHVLRSIAELLLLEAQCFILENCHITATTTRHAWQHNSRRDHLGVWVGDYMVSRGMRRASWGPRVLKPLGSQPHQ